MFRYVNSVDAAATVAAMVLLQVHSQVAITWFPYHTSLLCPSKKYDLESHI